MSPILYPEILEVIEKHKDEIVQIVNRCANEMAKVYSKNIDVEEELPSPPVI